MWFCYLHARLYKCVIFIADIYQNSVFFLLNTSRQRFGVSHLNINEEINILFSKDIKTVNTFINLQNIYIKYTIILYFILKSWNEHQISILEWHLKQ